MSCFYKDDFNNDNLWLKRARNLGRYGILPHNKKATMRSMYMFRLHALQ